MAYCTPEDVTRYATLTAQADANEAIAVATDIIHLYTGDRFSTTTVPVTTVTNSQGLARLPYTARTVTAVALADSGELLPADCWVFTNGRNATIRVFSNLPTSVLIAGREPWTPTTANRGIRINVEGTFGFAVTPAAVKEATAMLAAHYLTSTGQATLTEAGIPTVNTNEGIASISVEGYAVTYTQSSSEKASTGSTVVDRMLAPYRRIQRGRWS